MLAQCFSQRIFNRVQVPLQTSGTEPSRSDKEPGKMAALFWGLNTVIYRLPVLHVCRNVGDKTIKP